MKRENGHDAKRRTARAALSHRTVELNYAEGPVSGEALLYLHGGEGRRQEERALLEELASAFQVDGLDLRGHGLSGCVGAAPTG